MKPRVRITDELRLALAAELLGWSARIVGRVPGPEADRIVAAVAVALGAPRSVIPPERAP